MFSAYTQEVSFKSSITFNLFYLRFCFRPDVCTGNFSVKICAVVPRCGGVRKIALLHTHTIFSQNFTNNCFLHTTRSSHATFYLHRCHEPRGANLLLSAVPVHRHSPSFPAYLRRGGIESLHISLVRQGV